MGDKRWGRYLLEWNGRKWISWATLRIGTGTSRTTNVEFLGKGRHVQTQELDEKSWDIYKVEKSSANTVWLQGKWWGM